jgi:hypothetical protein
LLRGIKRRGKVGVCLLYPDFRRVALTDQGRFADFPRRNPIADCRRATVLSAGELALADNGFHGIHEFQRLIFTLPMKFQPCKNRAFLEIARDGLT